MAIPVAVLGFVQIAAGPESRLNTYLSYSEDVEAAGTPFGAANDIVRTSGTFSYISGYTTFLSFVAFLAIGYNMARGWRLKKNIAPILALILVIGAMFTTGSRAPVYSLVATGPLILGMAVASRVLAPQTAMRLFILIPVIAIVAVSLSPRAYEGFLYRTTDSSGDTLYSRAVSAPLDQTIGALSEAPALGFGIGTTHPASLTIMQTDEFWWLQNLLVEEEPARITEELGLIGLLLIYFLRFLIAMFALRCAMSFKDPAYRSLGVVLTAYLALYILLPSLNNPTAGLYYWGALGLLLAMQRLEQALVRRPGATLAASRARVGRSRSWQVGFE
jgi:hypothetical protein